MAPMKFITVALFCTSISLMSFIYLQFWSFFIRIILWLTQVALEYSNKYSTDRVRVLTLAKNRGKGGAVRLGMLSARGRKCLFADADGATKFTDLQKLEESLQQINTREVQNVKDVQSNLM